MGDFTSMCLFISHRKISSLPLIPFIPISPILVLSPDPELTSQLAYFRDGQDEALIQHHPTSQRCPQGNGEPSQTPTSLPPCPPAAASTPFVEPTRHTPQRVGSLFCSYLSQRVLMTLPPVDMQIRPGQRTVSYLAEGS